jgi:transposase
LEPKSAILVALKSSVNRRLAMTYLTLSDDEWAQIRAVLPIPKRGPTRPRDRAVCAAFLFSRAAGVSLESLPLGQFPDSIFLRSTQQRWLRDGTLRRLFEIGAEVQARMERQYDDEIRRLTWDRVAVTGEATASLPRWTHVRQR